MLCLRLQRHGSHNSPFYHIVATDSRKKLSSGVVLEKLGYYDPRKNPSAYNCKVERMQHWFGQGAQLSPAVATILRKQKIKLERAKTTAPTGSKKSSKSAKVARAPKAKAAKKS